MGQEPLYCNQLAISVVIRGSGRWQYACYMHPLVIAPQRKFNQKECYYQQHDTVAITKTSQQRVKSTLCSCGS
jgi:hypothetical protein